MKKIGKRIGLAVLAAVVGVAALHASSHREAPGSTKSPKTDGSDFYMFRSYEAGRAGYVTLLANYIPLQDAYGGPNFFMFDPDAVYEIHVDNDGDAREDLTFQFRFRNKSKDISLNIGGKSVPVPLINVGRIGPAAGDTAALNVIESYSLTLVRGDRGEHAEPITNAATGGFRFIKPADRIGDKSIRDDSSPLGSVPSNNVYETYADNHIYPIDIPGCAPGRVFVGQRREGFVVNLTETFDLINDNPIGPRNGEPNDLADKNMSTLALEVPVSCLTRSGQPIIGAWTTASVSRPDGSEGKDRKEGRDDDQFDRDHDNDDHHESVQVSRLGNPLVNELVIGLRDKDRFNASEPKNDAQFATYVTNPTLPALIQALFGVPAPATPRTDLVQVFLTGVPGLNQPPRVKAAEMLRLNTAITPKPAPAQDSLGVLAGDTAGFPNGRRPGDDVVDIALRAVEGVLLSPPTASTVLPYTDGALVNATIAYTPDGTITGDVNYRLFRDTFPYLQTPLSGSPNPTHTN